MVCEISDENFTDEVEHSELPCILDFVANWCQPCKQLAPVFEKLSQRYEGKVKFCRVNTDENKGLRVRFAVAVLPYIVWVDGARKSPLFDRLVTEQELIERIDYMLAGGTAPTTSVL